MRRMADIGGKKQLEPLQATTADRTPANNPCRIQRRKTGRILHNLRENAGSEPSADEAH
jgi:hypothetical protein